MKPFLITTIAAVLLVGCGESQQSAPSPDAKPAEPVAEGADFLVSRMVAGYQTAAWTTHKILETMLNRRWSTRLNVFPGNLAAPIPNLKIPAIRITTNFKLR